MASTSSFASPSTFLSDTKTSTNFTSRRPNTIRFRPSQISAAYASVDRPRSDSISTSVGSLYDVLGLRTSASCQEIKQAYRRLARVSHPDVACSGDDEFIRIHSAYFVTRQSRRSYEMTDATSYGCSMLYENRRWETDQCW